MATIKHYKVVAALPSTLVADSIYLVRVGTGFDLYVTNSSGTIVAYPANYQAGSANLNALSGLSGAANKAPYFTAAGAMAVYDLTVFGRAFAGAADEAAARLALELGTAATFDIGTSGANVPLLSSENTWSGRQTVGAGGSGYVAIQVVRADQGVVSETDALVLDIQTGTGAARFVHVAGANQRWIAIPRSGAAPTYRDASGDQTMWHAGNLDNTDSGWINCTLSGGWTNFTGRTAQYRRIGKRVYLRGAIQNATFANNNTVFWNIPSGYRPLRAPWTMVTTCGAFLASAPGAVYSSNTTQAVGFDGATASGTVYVNLDGVSWDCA